MQAHHVSQDAMLPIQALCSSARGAWRQRFAAGRPFLTCRTAENPHCRVALKPSATVSLSLRAFCPADEAAVLALWRACQLVRPWNDPRKDIARKLRVNPEWFLVGEWAGRVVATVMIGYEGHRGWINYLAVEPALQRSGVGRALMAEAERMLRAAGCPKIALQVRRTNADALAFYERLGFAADDVVSLGKRLERDDE